MPQDDGIPRLSYGVAKTLVTKSALHAYEEHRLLGNNRKEATAAMDEGKLLERLLLRFDLENIVSVDASSWQTKAAKEAREAAVLEGKLAVLTEKLEAAKESAEIIYKRFLDEGYDLRDPEALIQHRIEWVNKHGNACSGVLDWYHPKKGIILDLKKTSDASDMALQRSIFNFGYDIQENVYREAVEAENEALLGRVKMFFLFAETDAPFAVNPVMLDGSMAEIGRRRWDEANVTWKECLSTGVWPGYAKKGKRIEASAWQLGQSLKTELLEGTDFELVHELGGIK